MFVNDKVYSRATVLTPHDTNSLTVPCHALWVGGAGAITGITLGGDTVLLSGIPAGTLLPISFSVVKATGTTATLIAALG
jgi:hypothetical protein